MFYFLRLRTPTGLFFILIMTAILLLSTRYSQSDQDSDTPHHVPLAFVIDLKGVIGPVMVDFIRDGLTTAAERQATFIILRIDTPGGLVTSMRDIVQSILNSSVPVISYVSPQGAHAASAGTFIVYATHIAAMAPGTNIGAASPVTLSGDVSSFRLDTHTNDQEENDPNENDTKTNKEVLNSKIVNDLAALIRSLAEMRGRSVEFAENAVRKAHSLNAREALEQNVIEIIALTLDDLIEHLHGRMVDINGHSHTLSTDDLVLEPITTDWQTRLLMILTDPDIAFILMQIGIYGVLFEIINPGAFFPGVLGIISLVIGLYSLSILPVTFTGVALLVLGLSFMIAEGFLPSFGILGIGGGISFLLGATMLFDDPSIALDPTIIVGTTVVMALVLFVLITYAVRTYRCRVTTGHEVLIGGSGTVMMWYGTSGFIMADGERWSATCTANLEANQSVRIIALKGLTMTVEPIDAKPLSERNTNLMKKDDQ